MLTCQYPLQYSMGDIVCQEDFEKINNKSTILFEALNKVLLGRRILYRIAEKEKSTLRVLFDDVISTSAEIGEGLCPV